jgi:uroporphyrinogen-III synthase
MTPVIVPLIAYEAGEPMPEGLARGDYDWLVVTSARTVEALGPVAASTKVIAVGEATAAALRAASVSVHVVPRDTSAAGIADEWPGTADETRVLLPQSDLADRALASSLEGRGLVVRSVVAYRTVAVAVPPEGRTPVDWILVTSGSVARQVAAQLAPLPPGTRVACIGERTAAETRAAGLPVHAVAAERTLESLIAAL